MGIATQESGQEALRPLATGYVWTIVAVALVLGVALTVFYSAVYIEGKDDTFWRESQELDLSRWSSGSPDPATVTLTRTMCFGSCPAYKVSVNTEGLVTFKGESFTCVRNPSPANIDPREARRLIAGLLDIQFWSLPFEKNAGFATDAPTATIALTGGGSTHVVEHYHGDMGAPRVLRAIEDRIDEVTRTKIWVGLDEYGRTTCGVNEPTEKPLLQP